MNRRRFILSMFAAGTLLAVGVKLPRHRYDSIWLWNKASDGLCVVSEALVSFDRGVTWHDASEVNCNGMKVERWVCEGGKYDLSLYQPDPQRQPTYQGNVIWFNGANELRMDNRSA